MDDEIVEKYFSTGGLWAPTKFAKKYKFPLRDVKRVFKGLKIEQMMKPQPRKNIVYNKIISKPKIGGRSYSMQVDIYDFGGASKRKAALQGGYRYVLGIIDTFSRKVWLYKMKTKALGEVCGHLEAHYKENPYRNWTGDNESSWTSKRWRAFAKKNDIKLYYTEVWSKRKDTKTAMIERFWRTFKTLLDKIQIRESSKQVMKHLDEIEENYNTTPHRSLNWATPNDVYENNESSEKQEDREVGTFEVGDQVRLRVVKNFFEKKSGPVWSDKVYTIEDTDGNRYLLNNGRRYLAKNLKKVDEAFNPRRRMRGRPMDDRPERKLYALPDELKKVAPVLKPVPLPPRPPRRSTRLRTKERVSYKE